MQILLSKRRFSEPQVSGHKSEMKRREAHVLRPIRQRKAIERGRRISNATISLILSFVVTAAAQSERINQESRILGSARNHGAAIRQHLTSASAMHSYALGE